MTRLMGRVPRERGSAPDSVPHRLRGTGRMWLWLALPALLFSERSFAAYEEYLVNDDFVGQEHRFGPAAIALEDGHTLALWLDNGRGHVDILARTLAPDLAPVGEAMRVNSDEGLFSHDHLFASSPGGGAAIAVWEDTRLGTRAVFGRVFSTADGSPVGGDLRISGDLGFGEAHSPRAATNRDGESLVVWIANLHLRPRVIAQRVAPNGALLGPSFEPVPEEPNWYHATPSVSALPDGGWVVAWAAAAQLTDWNIWYRFLDAEGDPEGAPVRANTDVFGVSPQIEPTVLARDTDIVIAWSDGRSGNLDIWGRLVGLDGVPLGDDSRFQEAANTAGDGTPQLALGADGGFAASWFGAVDNRQRWMVRFFDADGAATGSSVPFDDPSEGVLVRGGTVIPRADGWTLIWGDDRTFHYDVRARVVDGGGVFGPVTRFYELPRSASQVFADVALFPDGRGIVVWSELQFGALAIFGRFLDASGAPSGGSFQVSAIPANAQFSTIDGLSQLVDFSPAVAASADGFVVTWAVNQEGGRLNLWAQYFEPDGTPIGGNFLIAPGLEETPQSGARPAMLPGGGFAIASRINVTDNGGDVFLQLYGADGLPDGPRIQCADSPVAAQIKPAISVSQDGTIAVVWMDQRFGGWDIFGQRFTRTGVRIGENQIQHSEDEPNSDQASPSVAIESEWMVSVWDTRALLVGLIEGRLENFPSLREDVTEVALLINGDRVQKGPKAPKVALAADGRFVVCWWENADGQTQIIAQRYDVGGPPIGDPYPIHGTGFEGSRLDPRVAVLGDQIQYVWTDSRRGKGWDIRARRVDWDFEGAPSPVRLERLEASSTPRGVEVLWRTAAEIDFSEFRLWREEAESLEGGGSRPGAQAVTIATGIQSSEGGEYRYLDATAPAGFLAYYLEAVDRDGSTEFFGPIPVRVSSDGTALSAWPNPFQDQVRFRLVEGVHRVHIVDAAGRRIRSLEARQRTEGWMWDGRDAKGVKVPAGLYFARAEGTAEAVRILRIR